MEILEPCVYHPGRSMSRNEAPERFSTVGYHSPSLSVLDHLGTQVQDLRKLVPGLACEWQPIHQHLVKRMQFSHSAAFPEESLGWQAIHHQLVKNERTQWTVNLAFKCVLLKE